VNAIRGDQYGMTAEEVEVKLRAKLRENFTVSMMMMVVVVVVVVVVVWW
jgi:hypothetical protein